MLVFGWIGGSLSVAYTAPQILHMWRSKSADGVSALSMWVRMVSLVLYIVHGVLIMDPPIIVMSALAATHTLCILFLHKKYYGVATPQPAVDPCVADTVESPPTTTAT
jgi:MtN3 and saliva related transmembrane protein